MSFLKHWSLLALIGLPVLATTSGEGALPTGVRDLLPANDQCLISRYERYSLYAVTVLEVDDAAATNEHPPKGRVEVREVIRGPGTPGPVAAVWQTTPTSGDYESAAANARVRPEWYRLPVRGPRPGERAILCGYYDVSRRQLEVAEGHTFRDTPGNRETLKQHMAPPERDSQQQLILAGCLLALPALNGILMVLARGRKPFHAANVLIALGTLVLYFYYEAGYSARMDIRIDLILIWPLLAASLGIGVIGTVKLFQK